MLSKLLFTISGKLKPTKQSTNCDVVQSDQLWDQMLMVSAFIVGHMRLRVLNSPMFNICDNQILSGQPNRPVSP
ncbi:hypothetical protein ACOSP7_025353 [Xanthoceras sorbifolium]